MDGSLFRSGETASVRQIVTCGITPHPPHARLSKTALSATEAVATRHFESTLQVLFRDGEGGGAERGEGWGGKS